MQCGAGRAECILILALQVCALSRAISGVGRGMLPSPEWPLDFSRAVSWVPSVRVRDISAEFSTQVANLTAACRFDLQVVLRLSIHGKWPGPALACMRARAPARIACAIVGMLAEHNRHGLRCVGSLSSMLVWCTRGPRSWGGTTCTKCQTNAPLQDKFRTQGCMDNGDSSTHQPSAFALANR